MANYFCIFGIADRHIDFLVEHPHLVDAFVEGRMLEVPRRSSGFFGRLLGGGGQSEAFVAPTGWPAEDAEMFRPEVSGGNVELYHEILNGFV